MFPIEAAYLVFHFKRCLKRSARRETMRMAHNAIAEMEKAGAAAAAPVDAVLQAASARIRCPLLSDRGACILYEYRPITCRLYGIPTSIRGMGSTCGKSGFEKGRTYPTVNWDAIHERLFRLSVQLLGLEDADERWAEAGKLVSVAMILTQR